VKLAGLLLPLLIAMGAIVPAPPASAASRSCGYVNPAEYDVHIERGQVSCKEARKAITTVIRGGGKEHGDPNNGLSTVYWTLPGGWRCSTGAGGAWSCMRGGTLAEPRDRIWAEQRVEEEAAAGHY
jgi:hypothetical protein